MPVLQDRLRVFARASEQYACTALASPQSFWLTRSVTAMCAVSSRGHQVRNVVFLLCVQVGMLHIASVTAAVAMMHTQMLHISSLTMWPCQQATAHVFNGCGRPLILVCVHMHAIVVRGGLCWQRVGSQQLIQLCPCSSCACTQSLPISRSARDTHTRPRLHSCASLLVL